MGDIADMMLDGTLCEGCGVYIDHPDADMADWPRLCASCAKDARRHGASLRDDGFGGYQVTGTSQDIETVSVPRNCKVICPECGKRSKAAGIWDHMRNAHGIERDS